MSVLGNDMNVVEVPVDVYDRLVKAIDAYQNGSMGDRFLAYSAVDFHKAVQSFKKETDLRE